MKGSKVLDQFNTRWKTALYLLVNLPSAYFMGIKIMRCDRDTSEVSVPFSFRSKNPFKSVYFAAQAAAAEISTGVLALVALEGNTGVSMLVKTVKGEFVKKATTDLSFICLEGAQMEQAVKTAVETGEPVEVEVCSTGYNQNGEVVSTFFFTWTFRKKRNI